mmetsp:Transcript_20893/g.49616  ORF Transcript_20893/g.49616 Transcript_20893/m.49616 type:complete len:118 (-) Transcript_20893:506-859(-)
MLLSLLLFLPPSLSSDTPNTEYSDFSITVDTTTKATNGTTNVWKRERTTLTLVWSRLLAISDDDDATEINGVDQGSSVKVIRKLDDGDDEQESGRLTIPPCVVQLLLCTVETIMGVL